MTCWINALRNLKVLRQRPSQLSVMNPAQELIADLVVSSGAVNGVIIVATRVGYSGMVQLSGASKATTVTKKDTC